jgi:hypothetical protein
MFRAAHSSLSGALTVFADSGLHTHVVTGRSQVWNLLEPSGSVQACNGIALPLHKKLRHVSSNRVAIFRDV